MANNIRIRRRAAGGAAGAPSSLANAELAYNEQDDTLYYGKGTGGAGGSATQIIPIGGPGGFATLGTSQTITGAKTFSGAVVVPDPTDPTHAANKAYVDARAAGLDPKASVKVVATANQTLSGGAGSRAIDGYIIQNGDRVLLVGQTNAAENGIWQIPGFGAWSRPTDFVSGFVTGGAYCLVDSGTQWGGTGWVLKWSGSSNPAIDSDGLEFVQFSGAGEIIVDGTQLTKSGNTLAIGVIALANGGTGATTAANARTNLGLDSMATQAASNVAITGGTIDNITIDGGTY